MATSAAPAFRADARLRIVSIDSSRAASMKAHVLTTTRSASPGPSAGTSPSASSDADDLVGVDHVLRAAEGLDEEPARRSRAGSGGHQAIVPGCLRRLGGRCTATEATTRSSSSATGPASKRRSCDIDSRRPTSR